MVAITDTQTAVEFECGSSMAALESLPLPHHRPCHGDPEITHHIQSLGSVYSEKCGTSTTKAYLSELKKLAKLSGKQFEDVLKDELSRISESVMDGSVLDALDSPLDSGRPSLPGKSTEMPSDGLKSDLHGLSEATGLHTSKCTATPENIPS